MNAERESALPGPLVFQRDWDRVAFVGGITHFVGIRPVHFSRIKLMFTKLTQLLFALAFVAVLSGCEKGSDTAAGIADQAKAGVDSAAGSAKDATTDMVPEAAKETVDGAIDQGGEKAKEGIDAAAGTAE